MSRSSFVARRVSVVIAALAASLVVPSVTLADQPASPPPAGAAPKPVFPMAGKEFTQRIDVRLKKMHDRLEDRLNKNNPPDDVKKRARDAYSAMAAKAKAAAAKAAADGTVTLDEAKTVRKVFRDARKQARKEARARRAAVKRSHERK